MTVASSSTPASPRRTIGLLLLTSLVGSSLPLLFILLWSSGYVVGKIGLTRAGPLSLLSKFHRRVHLDVSDDPPGPGGPGGSAVLPDPGRVGLARLCRAGRAVAAAGIAGFRRVGHRGVRERRMEPG